MTIQPGTQIKSYQILELIGRGGMAEVYKAHHVDLNIDVALKLIRTDQFPPSIFREVVKRFRNEAQKMAQLAHPNIVRVSDYGTYKEIPYFVMDYLPGGTLKRYLGKPMPYQQAARLILPIADALAYAHSEGVIHRDVKPANILLDKKGDPMLSDFGVAKLVDSEQTQGLTATGASIGTPEYMAPEQASGKKIDHRVDVYSLGIIFYELITGRRPFTADTPMDVIIKQSRDPLPPPSKFAKDLPESVEEFLYTALAKEPSQRFRDMNAMADALAAMTGVKQAGETSVQPRIKRTALNPQPTPVRKPQIDRKTKEKPWLIGLLGVLGVGLLIIAGLKIMQPSMHMQPGKNAAQEKISDSSPQVSFRNGQLKVAVLAPLTGPVPTFGESIVNGTTLAIEEWNARGGVLGMEIVPVIEDSQCSAEPAEIAANKVINQDGVSYILGETCSSASLPISVIAEENQVLQISPTSTNLGVTVNMDGSTKEYIFRACFTDPFQGRVMAKFAIDMGFRTAFVMEDPGNEYVLGQTEEFRENFERLGGKIVNTAQYSGWDQDFTAILTAVFQSDADMIYMPDYYNVVNIVGRQAKEMGIDAIIFGGDGWDSSDLDRTAMDGYYYSNHYSVNDTRGIVQDWVEKYMSKYSSYPDALATLGYDSANLLFSAIEKAGVNDTAAVAEVLESNEFEMVTGKITFDQDHNPIKNAVVSKVNNGAIQFVTSVEP